MDKIIIQTINLNCNQEQAFNHFTENALLEKWLTVKADIELKVGGKYELFWYPEDITTDSTKDCKVLGFDKPNYINFEWKGPKDFSDIMNNIRPLTNVTVIFSPVGTRTKVNLIHTGWHQVEKWEAARNYFLRAWANAFVELGRLVNN